MEWKYRFDKERYTKQINDIWEWQKNGKTAEKEVMSEIHPLNACKLDWENLFDFYLESINNSFRDQNTY